MGSARHPLPIWPAAVLLLGGAALAQDPLHSFHGSAAGNRLGLTVAGAGHVNLNGAEDFVVGEPEYTDGIANVGRAHAYDGATGAKLHTWESTGYDDYFGWSVDGVGDVNGDGYDDVVVGAPSDYGFGKAGYVKVFSGKTGATIHTFQGDSPNDLFGQRVAGVGDCTGDHVPDILVAAIGDYTTGAQGYVRLFSGANGSLRYTIPSPLSSSPPGFGDALAGIDDVNGDGKADILIGFPNDDRYGTSGGSFWVHSGVDGFGLYRHFGSTGDRLGSALSGLGDVNGDGVPDYLVGKENPTGIPGTVRVFSGQTNTVLHGLTGSIADNGFGEAVNGGSDLNGDGVPDYLVGEKLSERVQVVSGEDSQILYEVQGPPQADWFGASVACSGDADRDGYHDWICGAPYSDVSGNNAGSAYAYSGLSGDIMVYCQSQTTTGGCVPHVTWIGGPPGQTGTTFRVEARGVPAKKPGQLFYGYAARSLPYFGGTLCCAPPLKRTPPMLSSGSSGCTGRYVFYFNAWIASGADPNLVPGVDVYSQYWMRDTGGVGNAALSDALKFTLQ